MALKTTKGEDLQIQGLVVMLYGEPGVGKTSTALTSAKPILKDFDQGAHRSKFRIGKDILRVGSWKEIVEILPNLEKELEEFSTIIIDTVDTCLDRIKIYIENNDFKLKKNQLQMYGKLKDEFLSFLNRITLLNKDVILIAHSTTEEKNGTIMTTAKITGGSKDIVRQRADFIGYIFMNNNKRTLSFSPTDYNEGKNPANFPVITIPDFGIESNYFENVLLEMRSSLQAINSEQEQMNKVLQLYKEGIYNANTLNEINTMLEKLKQEQNAQIKKQAWTILQNKATEKELEYSKENKHFYSNAKQVEVKSEPKPVIETKPEVINLPKLEKPEKSDFDDWEV